MSAKKAVIVPIEEYEEFQELLEDLHDLEVVLEREGEPTITLEELRKRLERRALIIIMLFYGQLQSTMLESSVHRTLPGSSCFEIARGGSLPARIS